MCRKRLSSPRCRSELIDCAWVVIVPGQKCIKKSKSADSVGKYIMWFKYSTQIASLAAVDGLEGHEENQEWGKTLSDPLEFKAVDNT